MFKEKKIFEKFRKSVVLEKSFIQKQSHGEQTSLYTSGQKEDSED